MCGRCITAEVSIDQESELYDNEVAHIERCSPCTHIRIDPRASS